MLVVSNASESSTVAGRSEPTTFAQACQSGFVLGLAAKVTKAPASLTAVLSRNSAAEHDAKITEPRRVDRRRRVKVVAVCGIMVLAIDAWLSLWLIPWIDSQEWARTQYGNVGYAVFFIMTLFTFLSSLAMVAYYFSRSSYTSDKWQ